VSAPTNSLCERCVSDGALVPKLREWAECEESTEHGHNLLMSAATALEARIAACGCRRFICTKCGAFPNAPEHTGCNYLAVSFTAFNAGIDAAKEGR
jgi:hypothetical protein